MQADYINFISYSHDGNRYLIFMLGFYFIEILYWINDNTSTKPNLNLCNNLNTVNIMVSLSKHKTEIPPLKKKSVLPFSSSANLQASLFSVYICICMYRCLTID